MPTLDYDQQQFPALFWGFVNPRWATIPQDAHGLLVRQTTNPPPPWVFTRHQTAGMATKHLVLAGVFITADPFPLQELVTEYESSLLGMWEDLPAWDTLQEYAKQLQKAQLAIPGDDAYRWLQEAFLPVDPETLFKRSQTWGQAQRWTGSDAAHASWPHWPTFDALRTHLNDWQSQSVVTYAAEHCTPAEQNIAPLWFNRPLVGAVVFENSD